MSTNEPEAIVLPELDDEPKNGYWAPEVSELELTDDEWAEGEVMGDITRDLAE